MNYRELEYQWALRRQELCQDKAKGMSGPELAKKHGISTQRVYQLLGLARKHRKRDRRILAKSNGKSLGK